MLLALGEVWTQSLARSQPTGKGSVWNRRCGVYGGRGQFPFVTKLNMLQRKLERKNWKDRLISSWELAEKRSWKIWKSAKAKSLKKRFLGERDTYADNTDIPQMLLRIERITNVTVRLQDIRMHSKWESRQLVCSPEPGGLRFWLDYIKCTMWKIAVQWLQVV